MAVGLEKCQIVPNFTSGYKGGFNYNTGTLLLKPTDAARRFVASWMGFQRKHLLEWGPEDFDKHDGNQRRSDQVGVASDQSGRLHVVWSVAWQHAGVRPYGILINPLMSCRASSCHHNLNGPHPLISQLVLPRLGILCPRPTNIDT